MHFEGICGLKTELNYPFNCDRIIMRTDGLITIKLQTFMFL